MATIKFTYALKRFYPELAPTELAADTVQTAVLSLDQIYPGISDYLIDERGQLRKHVNIFVDGELIQDRNTLLDQLQETSEVYIMQALSGG